MTSVFLAQRTHIMGVIPLLLVLVMISGCLVSSESPLAVNNTSSTLACLCCASRLPLPWFKLFCWFLVPITSYMLQRAAHSFFHSWPTFWSCLHLVLTQPTFTLVTTPLYGTCSLRKQWLITKSLSDLPVTSAKLIGPTPLSFLPSIQAKDTQSGFNQGRNHGSA